MEQRTKVIDFFFDFMSPFAYLAHSQLPELARKHGYELRYRPIDLPAAKLAAGNTGPPNVSMPIKLRYLRKDLDRWAERYKIPISFPPSLKSELANKGVFFAEAKGQCEDYVRHVWSHSWGEGQDMSSEELLAEIASELGWEPDAFLAYVHSEEAEDAYRLSNEEAHSRGVFGAPIMMIGEEMWWGNDRLFFLDEYLSSQ
jgi:2-hydroxychromene-2-carboxylate isomerase